MFDNTHFSFTDKNEHGRSAHVEPNLIYFTADRKIGDHGQNIAKALKHFSVPS